MGRQPESWNPSEVLEMQSRCFQAHTSPVGGLDYYGECRPSGEACGDFFDLVPLDRRELAISIGDISVKGFAGAIMLAGVQSFLRGLTAGGSPDLSGIVRQLNRTTCDVSPDDFAATLFYARIDPAGRQLRYVSAGHEPALLVHKDGGRAQRLDRTGTVLGLSVRSTFKTRTVPLEPGDTLIAFTDGIFQPGDGAGDNLREKGILEIVERFPNARAGDLVREVLDAAERYGACAGDDRTVVVARCAGPAAHSLDDDLTAEVELAAAC